MNSPQLSIKIYDENGDLLGYLIIDSTINNSSCGGVRMHSNVSEEEIRGLANAMTLKFGFLGLPKGGAKAGIIADSTLPMEQNIKRLSSFGRSLAPLIKNRIYIPGQDLGTTESAVRTIWQGAGLEYEASGHEISGIHTSYTVSACAAAAIKFQGLDIAACKIAIEGFGSVGSHTARNLSERGAKIVGISTIEGAVYNNNGFDIEALITGRENFGDSFVKFITNGQKISHEELLQLDLDVLIPCARAWTIHSDNVDKIKARIVCPGANIPVTASAEKILFDNSVLYIPDFVANSGGVLGSPMRYLGLSEAKMKKYIDEIFEVKVGTLLRQARENNMTLAEFARLSASKKFEITKKMHERKGKVKIRSIVSGLLRKMPFTKIMASFYAGKYIENMILSDFSN